MTGFPVAEDDLRALTPRDAARYLRTRGWVEGERVRYSMRWRLRLGDREHTVLLPAMTALTDYPNRMADLLQDLGQVEGRTVVSVHADMVLTDVDTQEIRTQPNTPSGTIPLLEGAAAVTRVKDLLLSAATAEVLDEPRLVLPRNKPRRAKEFLNQALLGTAKPGSYIFSVQIPVEAHPGSPSNTVVPRRTATAELPFGRRVSQRLYEAVHAARKAAMLSTESGDLAVFAEQARLGVSADLCESLAGLAGDAGNGFAITFGWSPRWSVPHTYTQPRADFSAELLPSLSGAAEMLRSDDPTPESYPQALILGPSLSLARVGTDGGHILVAAGPGTNEELRGRQIRVRLTGEQYDQAAHAHAQHHDLIFQGTVVRQWRTYEMAHPTRFVVSST
ncbi:hypothetical protein OG352_34325 [Streptomyces sp. NBC_01485]|uniref:hypothetical protein n=1 Tax=Streptomyces sp. NBC_01485 TaxID=2903884 RepID=UPI002E36A36E|nr:hypothetical protein [Streptomyces sp. NBC_01485]